MGDELLVRVHYLGWRDVWDEEACSAFDRRITAAHAPTGRPPLASLSGSSRCAASNATAKASVRPCVKLCDYALGSRNGPLTHMLTVQRTHPSVGPLTVPVREPRVRVCIPTRTQRHKGEWGAQARAGPATTRHAAHGPCCPGAAELIGRRQQAARAHAAPGGTNVNRSCNMQRATCNMQQKARLLERMMRQASALCCAAARQARADVRGRRNAQQCLGCSGWRGIKRSPRADA